MTARKSPKHLQRPQKGSRRNKRTIPKTQIFGSPATPPTSPMEGVEEGEGLQLITSTSRASLSLLSDDVSGDAADEEDRKPPPENPLVNMENYRRFSSRSRKKPDFFEIMCPEAEGDQTPQAKRKRSGAPMTRRALNFNGLQRLTAIKAEPPEGIRVDVQSDSGDLKVCSHRSQVRE